MTRKRIERALELCDWLFKALDVISANEPDFAMPAKTRLFALERELREQDEPTERQVSTLRELGASVEMRRVSLEAEAKRPKISPRLSS